MTTIHILDKDLVESAVDSEEMGMELLADA